MSREHNPSSFEEKSRDSAGFTNLHDGNLFDQDEDAAGERYDLATGKRINNSSQRVEHLGLEITNDPFGETAADPQATLDFVDKWLEAQDKKDARFAKSSLRKNRKH